MKQVNVIAAVVILFQLNGLTKYAFVAFESPHGKGVYTAKATQFAKIVNKIKYSKGLSLF